MSSTRSSSSRRRRSVSSSQQQGSSHPSANYSPSASLRNGYPNIGRQNTHRFDNRTAASSNTRQQPNTNASTAAATDEQPDIPLQDRIAASAVAASLEFLRIAGGVTLSTTGTLMQPPLHVTQKYVLPQLWHALLDLLQKDTPERLQGWFRIVSSSVQHFVSVLRETAPGQALRERLLIVWADLVQLLATDASRQSLIDYTACWVKFAAWCDSTECHDYFDQLCVYWIRVLQVLSSGKTQQLILDCTTVLQSLAQVLNDPQTTTAWAEVTAYLCYALEMEQAKQFPVNNSHNNFQQRHDRDVYQHELHHARISLQNRTKHDGTPLTVEEAILSSMGKLPHDLPTQIVCNDCEDDHHHSDEDTHAHDPQQTSIDWDQESSIRQQLDESIDGMHDKIHKGVDVAFLRERILPTKADECTINQPEPATTKVTTANEEDASKIQFDIEDLPVESNAPSKRHRTRAYLQPEKDAPLLSDPWQPNMVQPQEGETTVQNFYRVLGAVLEEKRSTTNFASKPKGRVLRPNRSSFSLETLKERLLAQSLPKADNPSLTSRFGSRLVKWILFGLALLASLWFVLGCYGFYVLVIQPVHLSNISPTSKWSSNNEIMIRIVREGGTSSGGCLPDVDQQRLAQCVGDSIQ